MVLMNCFMKRGVDGDAVCCCCCGGCCPNEVEDNSEEEEGEEGSNVSTTVDILFDAVSFTTLHALFLWIIEQERESEREKRLQGG